MPKVTVFIPTYNCAHYLERAIASVLEQTWEDFELLICDDASTDNTAEVVERFTDRRIRYVRFDRNAGQAGCFNRGIELARGEMFTLLSADDYFYRELLRDRVTRLDADQGIDYVAGATDIVDKNGMVIGAGRHWQSDRPLHPKEFLSALLRGSVVSTLTLVLRTSYLKKVGLFRTEFTWGHDWEWMMRVAEGGNGYYVSRPLAAYRTHDASGTAEQLSAAKNGSQERRILQETLARLCSSDASFKEAKHPVYQALSRRHMFFAGEALRDNKRSVARNNLWYALLADFTMALRPTFWALLVGSVGLKSCYTIYRRLRSGAQPPAPGTTIPG